MWQFLVLSILATSSAELEWDVTTLRGERLSGTLVEISSEELILQTSEGQQSIPSSNLLSVVSSAVVDTLPPLAEAPVTAVHLVDGSRLQATSYAVESGRATIQLSGGGVARTSTKSIHYVRFKKQAAAIQEQWQRILTDDRSGDVIVVRKTSQPTEQQPLAIALDHLEGILRDMGPNTVEFEFEGKLVPVPRAKVEGVIYHHPRSLAPRKLVCQLIDLSDTRWNVKSLKVRQSKLELTSSAGVRFSLPFSQVAKLDYSSANLVYLSELEPESKNWRPHVFSQVTPPSVSKWFRPRDNLPMLLKGEAYENGLALHSRTRLTYRLTQDYDRFLATVGIDDRYRNEGNVLLQITGNKGVLFEGHVRGGDEPLMLDLDVAGVRRLTILVDFGRDDSDLGDYLNLCDARLTK